MSQQRFSLKPFIIPEKAAPSTNQQITGSIARHLDTLSIAYKLSGDLTNVLIAPRSSAPTRKHDLWEDTCFEFFLGIKHSPTYWEFNLSPAGYWNAYRFDGYRQGMREELAFASLPFQIQNQQNTLSLSLTCSLAAIVPAHQTLDVAVTAVVKPIDGAVMFWALTHAKPDPDFHERTSFIIDL